MRRNASPSRRRGTTPSCTMKSGDSRPTALKALLRPFQIARRSSASRAGRASTGWLAAMISIEPLAIRRHHFARAFQFHDEHRFAARRIFRMHRRHRRLERERVHDFHRARQQPAGDDRGDRIAGLLQRAIAGQHRVKTFRPRQQLQRDFQRDAEQPFVAGEQSAPIRPHVLAARPAPLDHFAGRQHGLDPEHVVGGHAVFQAMRAAGIEGHVAADGADGLAGRIGRVMQSVRAPPPASREC